MSSVEGSINVSEGSFPARESTVLVTGGSGFVGSWAIALLLRQGYRVRTTVRNLAREQDVRAAIGSQVDPEDRLSFFAADLLRDEGWDHAVTGSDFVLHVASPMPVGEYRKQDVVAPAREGTRRVLEASREAGVKRVVITSSVVASMPKDENGSPIDEGVWTDLASGKINDYSRAKTLAEKDAWDFVRSSGGKMELATILPGSIQGPVLGADYSASIEFVGRMLKGQMPLLPRFGLAMVDVRDLVELHIRAMTSPAAAGERFIACGDFLWLSDMATILRDALGERASKVPTRNAPDWLVRFAALFNEELRQLTLNLGIHRAFTSAKAERLLGWHLRPAATSIVDTANSLLERQLV